MPRTVPGAQDLTNSDKSAVGMPCMTSGASMQEERTWLATDSWLLGQLAR